MTPRFLAIGDSFTEGVGDPNPRFPNGCRGWADRVARQLAKQDPAWTYANLAVRSKRLRGILDEQLEQGLALRPTLTSLYAGGNDLLEWSADVPALMEEYDDAVARIKAAGSEVLLFTGFDVSLSPLVAPMRRRNWEFNDAVREIAERRGAILVDYWAFEEFAEPACWAEDRLHMSTTGHRQLARRVLETLDVRHTIRPGGPGDELWDRPSSEGLDEASDIPRNTAEASREILRRAARLGRALAEEEAWLRRWVGPMLVRRARGITLGDELEPKWPYPIRPAQGMKWNAKRRARVHVAPGTFLPPDLAPWATGLRERGGQHV
ncbi:SGNH/GDSL hydrolase family protein [Falsarthrobacter nasiphocae]|uniref:Lysophospholipase L1-like esterase n=1 Tax=Falsarthrobacter nasiphocae TaxID=189863 RepID=A0AAE4C755_9MICC|nr:SGNH/GDSL hydrolase family protein [Falsarthrobacter nasiphocae]MDR6892194.1 lysophospholipase L1-like esterase [Falsarthrobacter nasiphocae]